MRVSFTYLNELQEALEDGAEEQELVNRLRWELVEWFHTKYPLVNPMHVLATLEGASADEICNTEEYVPPCISKLVPFTDMDWQGWSGAGAFSDGTRPRIMEFANQVFILDKDEQDPVIQLTAMRLDDEGHQLILQRSWPEKGINIESLAQKLGESIPSEPTSLELAFLGLQVWRVW